MNAPADEPITTLDASALSDAIHARRISCRAVMQAYLERIERLNPHYNALVSLRPRDVLLAEADACDAELALGHSRGWLHGVPQAIKDLANAAGLPTTLGSPLMRHFVAREDGLIRYELTVERAGTELVVRGRLEVPLRLRCSRCAQFFSTTARVSSFLHAYEWSEHPEFLDVTADVREDLLLEIPGFPLCHEGCKGLCAQCGSNLNDKACGCRPPEGRPSPWAALEGWQAHPEAAPPVPGGKRPRRK